MSNGFEFTFFLPFCPFDHLLSFKNILIHFISIQGVNYSGATLGLVVAITLSLASHAFLACLATFFFSSSRVTKFRSHLKRKFEADFKGGMLYNIHNSSLNAPT